MICTALCVVLFALIFTLSNKIADNYRVVTTESLKISNLVPVSVEAVDTRYVDKALCNTVGAKYDISLKIFGVIPITKSSVEIVDEMYVVPLGSPFGMKIYTDGVLVVNISDVDTASGIKSPAEDCGLSVGDFIISIDGEKVYTNEDVASIIEASNGEALQILIKRNTTVKTLSLVPLLSESTNTYKAGIWVRDSSAGIGTLTFYYPSNQVVCGLGHSVSDADTGQILSVGSGELVAAEIISRIMAQKGTPGELQGRLLSEKYGNILLNCESGVYSKAVKSFSSENIMRVALKQEIENGKAYILTTVEGTVPKLYECEIKINRKNHSKNQDLVIQITDSSLLQTTGGILQGMSGSPIIQNDKLVGAVTHVLVDDSSKGYGILAENMLETAQGVSEQQLKEAS